MTTENGASQIQNQSSLLKQWLLSAGIVIAVIAIGLVSVHFLGNNNPIEKVAEEVLLEDAGINLDFDHHD